MIMPAVGRIIHAKHPTDITIPCRAAIVTGIDHHPRTLHVAVFTNRGDISTAVIANPDDPDTWHDPRDCTDPRSVLSGEFLIG